MQSDGFLISRKPQPPKMMPWPRAAKLFLDSRGTFLRFDPSQGQVLRGAWSVTCLPFRGFTDQPLHMFNQDVMKRIRDMIEQLKKFDHPLKYSRVDGMERLLRLFCEYPPYSLEDDWDGKKSRRWTWAAMVYRNYPGLRV